MTGRQLRATLTISVLLVVLPGLVEAQTAPLISIPPGQRVRVTSLNNGMVKKTATTLYSRGDSIGLRMNGSDTTAALIMSHVDKLEVSGGTRRHALRGAGIGLSAGVLLGISETSESDCEPATGECVVEDVISGTAVVFTGIIGSLVGLAVGSLVKTERWTSIPLGNSRVGVLAVPSRNGLTLAGEIRF